MSSFHKLDDSSLNFNGTKTENGLCFVSSGIPSLDRVIDGNIAVCVLNISGRGIPSGALFVVEEDILGTYSRVLCKYYLAEGIVCKHDLFIASADENPEDLVKELPKQCTIPIEDEAKPMTNEIDQMKIAWRYEGLGKVESSFGSKTFGHHFDLSKPIDGTSIKDANITYWKPQKSSETVNGFKNIYYHQLLKSIQEVVSKEEYQRGSKKRNILRINIHSLGSPIWMTADYEDDVHSSSFGQDLLKFMYCLRVLLRDTYAVAFVSIPSHLFDDETLMRRLRYSVDNAVKIESFAGSSRETNPVYKDYHGLFHITKLSAINSLVPYVPPSLDLAFKLRRKKFVIEKLHLPPELQESSEREQDDITATPKVTCGGFKKKDIDF